LSHQKEKRLRPSLYRYRGYLTGSGGTLSSFKLPSGKKFSDFIIETKVPLQPGDFILIKVPGKNGQSQEKLMKVHSVFHPVRISGNKMKHLDSDPRFSSNEKCDATVLLIYWG